MTILKVHHVTTYAYKRPVGFGEHRILFRPRDSHDQRLLESKLTISPEPSDVFWVHDVFGNSVAVANFEGEADGLRFETDIVLDHTPQTRPALPDRRGARSPGHLPMTTRHCPISLRRCVRQYSNDSGGPWRTGSAGSSILRRQDRHSASCLKP